MIHYLCISALIMANLLGLSLLVIAAVIIRDIWNSGYPADYPMYTND